MPLKTNPEVSALSIREKLRRLEKLIAMDFVSTSPSTYDGCYLIKQDDVYQAFDQEQGRPTSGTREFTQLVGAAACLLSQGAFVDICCQGRH